MANEPIHRSLRTTRGRSSTDLCSIESRSEGGIGRQVRPRASSWTSQQNQFRDKLLNHASQGAILRYRRFRRTQSNLDLEESTSFLEDSRSCDELPIGHLELEPSRSCSSLAIAKESMERAEQQYLYDQCPRKVKHSDRFDFSWTEPRLSSDLTPPTPAHSPTSTNKRLNDIYLRFVSGSPQLSPRSSDEAKMAVFFGQNCAPAHSLPTTPTHPSKKQKCTPAFLHTVSALRWHLPRATILKPKYLTKREKY
eukprot:gb/GEZN01007991.1/.p1 GENE.gb/GEZN01007991.1/~~gb/GEZN01007991.1/.p1  ORF type:complete len:252 (-),score=12.25 gb/GEZN01007991.1/:625-1380(-)